MLAVKYTLFAIISTFINLLFQYLSLLFYSAYGALYLAMFSGTLGGLLVKYILDKKYIFYHTPANIQDDSRKFMLYSFMGIVTTMIFWSTEILFHTLLQSPYAKYIGALLGLSIGYIIKYFLDKKYVFIHKNGASL